MTKQDLIKKISGQTGVEQSTVLTVVESFMDSVQESLEKNRNVYLRGFGSFIIKRRAPKMARNISKNTSIAIPARCVPAFRPSKAFTAKVKEA